MGRNVNATHFPAEPFRYDGVPAGGGVVAPRRRREAAMGTFAEKNGRLAAVAAEGRPTCDPVYEKVAEEFLRQLSLDRDEGFAAAVARRFREAPAKVCCRTIGAWIDQRLLGFGWTQHDLADRIGVDRSAVTKWTTGGAISLGHLVLVLLEFRSDLADLPLPARQELALEGYLAALSYVRARIDPAGGHEPLDRERFWCLFHLFSEPYWERAIRQKDRQLVKKEADRVLRRAGQSLGSQPRRVVGVEGLRSLVEEWTAAWVICLDLLPGDWSIR
jgi:transcriptional regulator with XRE-family HTH domain